ncbi:hypothetical protein IVB69_10845 [Flavobacterium sp. J49]|uniref:hypothetical protein n=1 Tax=Flavobacterium sp. J49 TaxID=2718534 RepID=UPI0015949742|nr:hypothetical protein [Flavobacterium sp. J49]MBF6641978.1 hypothetical protein [Flavobacterium sp. J49]NIC03225.1 hypothetical protein [Flavobacterium sp. J49]
MKKLFFLICFICSTTVVMAQDTPQSNTETSNIELRFSSGLVFPLGDIKSSQNESFGMAKTGYKATIDFAYKFKNNFAAVMIVDYTTLGTDADKIAKSILDANPSYNSVEVKSGNYSVLSLLVGGNYTINLSSHFFIQGQLALGLATIKGPENEITVSSASPFEELKSAGTVNALAYQGKVSVNYNINTPLAIGLYTSYYETNPTFEIENSSIKQKLNSMSTGLQLTYKL